MSEEQDYAEDTRQSGALSEIVDMGHILMLLEIVGKGQSHGPDANYIVGEARQELQRINENCRANSNARAEERRQSEAQALAAQQELAAAEQAEEGAEPATVTTPTVLPRRI